jgi:hypothetical protein
LSGDGRGTEKDDARQLEAKLQHHHQLSITFTTRPPQSKHQLSSLPTQSKSCSRNQQSTSKASTVSLSIERQIAFNIVRHCYSSNTIYLLPSTMSATNNLPTLSLDAAKVAAAAAEEKAKELGIGT